MGEEVSGSLPERGRKPADVVDADVALRSLHAADIGPVEAGALCKRFLRPTQCLAKQTDVATDQPSPVRQGSGRSLVCHFLPTSHAQNNDRVTSIELETLSSIRHLPLKQEER